MTGIVDGVDGNLVGVDPMFVRDPSDGGDGWGDDPATPGVDEGANDDYGIVRLQSDSPAVNAGDNNLLPADTFDLDDDGNVTEPIPFDLDNELRVRIATVDMGAYEYNDERALVERLVINDGSKGRSLVTDLTITFNTNVSIMAGAFQLINRGTGENVLTSFTTQVLEGKSVVRMTFLEGPSVVFRPTGNTLDDGNYQLTIDASKVIGFGRELDGDQDGVVGGNYVFGDAEVDTFFRLFGDWDGSRFVGNNDYAAFRLAFRKSPGDDGYDSAFDSDGSDFIGNNDYALFRLNFRKGLPFE